MLRDVRSPFLRPRLFGVKYNTASNVYTQNTGIGFLKGTSGSSGSAVTTFVRAFARRGCVVANASSLDVGNGGFVGGTANTFPQASSHTLVSNNKSGSPTDGTVHALFLGFDSKEFGRYKKTANVVRCDFDQGHIRAFRINTTSSTITINGRNATLVKNGTGDVTITLKNTSAAVSLPVVVGTALSATTLICNTDAVTTTSFRIKLSNVAGSLTDGIVNILCLTDDQGTAERVAATPLMSSQRKPILFGYSAVYASGAPGYDFNSGDATLVNTATGRVTFTFKEAFRREPIVVAMPIANSTTQTCTIDNSSSTAFEVKNWTSGSALANPTDTAGFQLIGIGWDDPSEY